ncbi:growth/differentiation factor 2 [Thalassophryne amazonica]|uniref:growth/differentiation factor 2 n=1 Tax=Thalassophryne amazonica TaxID=390379 RepID=UPI0014719035|nr:growth/differentiation factor 2 [Thalassophryne amazonica]
MKSSRTFFFQMCLSVVVSIGCFTCKPLSNDVQGNNPDGLYRHLSEEDLLEEEDTNSWLDSLMGTMKEGFLRKLNLSDVPQKHSKIDPPQFMMELYNKYASDSSAVPQSDVIRSFAVQDTIQSARNGTKTRHRLLFNVSIPKHEKIITAELQLFFFPDVRSRVISRTFKATVKVYEVDYNMCEPTTQLLVGKEVTASQSVWETFDVTAAIQRWIKVGHSACGFDVAVVWKDCGNHANGKGGAGCLDMSISISGNTSAALIIFSNDLDSRRKETKKEIKEMILHEEEGILHLGADWNREYQMPKEIPKALNPQRKKRRAEREYCRRTSLKVNFRDIGWDSWIVAPPEYDAFECRGQCYYPLTAESTPSKHALIQALMNIRNPKQTNMACCVPIRLDPITVMYKENGRITIRYLYEDMKVAECGCR